MHPNRTGVHIGYPPINYIFLQAKRLSKRTWILQHCCCCWHRYFSLLKAGMTKNILIYFISQTRTVLMTGFLCYKFCCLRSKNQHLFQKEKKIWLNRIQHWITYLAPSPLRVQSDSIPLNWPIFYISTSDNELRSFSAARFAGFMIFIPWQCMLQCLWGYHLCLLQVPFKINLIWTKPMKKMAVFHFF